jgi:hypothetical protein
VSRRPRVIVAGYFVRFPLGGYVWQTLHYLIGLSRLGADVTFYEDSAYYTQAFDPDAGITGIDYAAGIRRASEVFARFGLGDRWVFWDAARDEYHGLSRAKTSEAFAQADLWLNVAGVNRLGDRHRPPTSVYVDIDPAFTQIRLEHGDAKLGALVAEHDLFFTFGENIGTERSPLPSVGIAWRPTRPPVVSDLWENSLSPADGIFTTIGKWDASDRDVEFRGERYHWRKSLEWRRFFDLPAASGERFELAMDVDCVPPDERALTAAGWRIRPPLTVSTDIDTYARYIQQSKGEFSAAKDMNVRLRSGWFSDRSASYLAAGRPVVVQDTGFGDTVPTGAGLFAVQGLEDAAEACRRISRDYAQQAKAARSVARESFEATKVLRPLLEAAGF